MNLEQFNNILANAQQDPQKILNSLSDKKRVQLGQSADNKRNQLFKPRTEQNIQSIPDGDGYITTGDGGERRMAGYDAYEVAHPEKMQDPGFLKHLDILNKSTIRFLTCLSFSSVPARKVTMSSFFVNLSS